MVTLRHIAVLAALTLTTACTSNVGSLSVTLQPSCRPGDDPLESIAETLEFSIRGPSGTVIDPVVASVADQSASLPELPLGSDYVLTVQGRGPEGQVVSRGKTGPFSVTDGTTRLSVYIGRIERFSQTPLSDDANRCTLRQPRAFHHASVLPDTSIVLSGGTTNAWRPGRPTDAAPTASLERLEGNALNSLPEDLGEALREARFLHSATVLSSGNIMIAGGIGDSGKALSSTEIFSATTNRTFPGQDMKTARASHGAISDRQGVLLAGGQSADGNPVSFVETVDADGVRALPQMKTPRRNFALVRLDDGTLLASGGFDGDDQPLASVEMFSPDSSGWQPGPDLGVARAWHTATLMPDGRVLIAGGLTDQDRATASVESYDPQQGAQQAAELQLARWAHTATILRDGRLLVVGGFTASRGGSPSRTVEQVTIGATGLVFVSPCCGQGLIRPRGGHAATLSAAGWLVVTGGITENPDRVGADDTAEVFVY